MRYFPITLSFPLHSAKNFSRKSCANEIHSAAKMMVRKINGYGSGVEVKMKILKIIMQGTLLFRQKRIILQSKHYKKRYKGATYRHFIVMLVMERLSSGIRI